jgi:choline dehydrogenase-like flavoprotein
VSIDLRDLEVDLREETEVCVIGSGGGGAVAAAEIAAGGRSVVVLEQGPHWTPKDFTQREEQMLPRLLEEAGMRQTVGGSVIVLQGRNVGGSTVHNLCYCFRAPDPILRLWRREFGLASLTPEALAPCFERVEQHLKVKPIREDEINALNRVFRAGAEKLGYSGLVAKHNRENCAQTGYCILGCYLGAKQSMLMTYVPRAEEAGARIFANARAEQIETRGGRVERVRGHAVDEAGRPGRRFEIDAKVVVLAAGAIASPDLLLRSEIANSSGLVGRNLHLHPQVMLAGIFEEPLHPYRGIPQSYYVDEFIDLERDPRSGYVLMPVAGFPALTAANLPGFGRDHFQFMKSFDRLAGLLVLVHDQGTGSVRPGASFGSPEIRYSFEEGDRRQLARGLVKSAEVLFAGGARRVVVPYWVDPLVLEPGDDLGAIEERGVREGEIAISAAHPQSTCAMGSDPSKSVVNEFGESHDVPGLFVADMSVFPTSLGAPPQITTAALADRTAHHILERWPDLAL